MKKNIPKILAVLLIVIFIGVVFSVLRSTVGWSCNDNFIDNRDGIVYKTTKIGEQCWIAENLNYITPESWCYNNRRENCDVYGRLYSNDAAQLSCPDGWKLPSDKDWEELETYLGMVSFDTGRPGWRISGDVGDKLKSSLNWDGSNSYGFGGIPGGYRLKDGGFYGLNIFGRWWTSTTKENRAWRRHLDPGQLGIFRSIHDVGFGYSVRCIKVDS